MTDDTDTTRTRRTAANHEQQMTDVEHTPPVDGARRTFERDAEGQPARTDGGQDTDDEAPEADADDDEEETDQMRDVDHTSPVEGPNRTFERGTDADVRE